MENVLIEFKKKAKKQNIIKAGLCSVAISLLFNIPFLIAFWIMDYKYKFIICAGIFIVGVSVLFPVLYFKKFNICGFISLPLNKSFNKDVGRNILT